MRYQKYRPTYHIAELEAAQCASLWRMFFYHPTLPLTLILSVCQPRNNRKGPYAIHPLLYMSFFARADRPVIEGGQFMSIQGDVHFHHDRDEGVYFSRKMPMTTHLIRRKN